LLICNECKKTLWAVDIIRTAYYICGLELMKLILPF